MTDLIVRKPPFRIDETVPFQWQPANPEFGLFGNAFTFVAIAFERYLVSATRAAADRFTTQEVADEAEAFVRQEAQHARAHRAHAKAMIANFPGLQDTYDAANRAFDEQLERHDLEYHLAYVANLEATFTPLFKMMFDNRGPLFEGGDERIGTLLLWHFAEEIEHRSSALIIQQDVTPNRWYRLRHVPATFKHVSSVFELVVDGINEHVPEEARGLPASIPGRGTSPTAAEFRRRLSPRRRRGSAADGPPSMLGHVPGRDLGSMVWRLANSQRPGHDPAHEPLPRYTDDWFAAWSAGDDVTTYQGARL